MVRLILLVRNRGSVLSNQSIPQRDTVIRTVGVEDDQRAVLEAMSARLSGTQRRKTLSDLEREKRKVIPTSATFSIVLGELLWILRPLVYCPHFSRFQSVSFITNNFSSAVLTLIRSGKSSWKPWFVSLLFDLASRGCTWNTELNESETQEMYRRGFLWFFYLLRSPFFEIVIGDPSSGPSRLTPLLNLIGKIPLVNVLSGSCGVSVLSSLFTLPELSLI